MKERTGAKKKWKRNLIITGAVIGAVVLTALCVLHYYTGYNRSMFKNENPYRLREEEELSFSRDGVTYKYNEDIVNVLLMGIDKTQQRDINYIVENGYQADAVFVAAINTKTGGVRIVNIPRDTLTEIMRFDRNGAFSRVGVSPICTAHSFGDGRLMSGQLMEAAVGNLLYGVPIHGYLSIDIDGISVLTEAVGGVEVELLEDFTAVDAEMTKGAIYTLDGEKAELYVRARQLPGMSGEDAKRIPRQIQFISAYAKAVKEKIKEEPGYLPELLKGVRNHISMDMTDRECLYVANTLLKAGIEVTDIETIAGGAEEEGLRPDPKELKRLVQEIYFVPA